MEYKKLPLKFESKLDGVGEPFLFEQIDREDSKNPTPNEIGFAVYRQTKKNSEAITYETVRIRAHNGYEINGVFIEPKEYYPKSREWGIHGMTSRSRNEAFNNIEKLRNMKIEKEERKEIIAEMKEKVGESSDIIYPKSPFTLAEFAAANNMEKSYAYLWVKNSKLRIVGTRRTNSRGRAATLFSV